MSRHLSSVLRISDHLIRPGHAHDFDMAICEVVPEDDGKAPGDMPVQIPPIFVPVAVIKVPRREIPDRLKSLQQKVPFALPQSPQKFENRRINQQPPFHSPEGSGILSSRFLTSSSVSQRLGSGSSSTAAISLVRAAHCFSRREMRKDHNSRRAPSSRAAASRFNVSKLMPRLNHKPLIPATPDVSAVTIQEFGCFVEILPGKDGMCHISELADFRVKRVEDVVKMGDMIWVEVLGVYERGKIKLSRKAAMKERDEAAAGAPSAPAPTGAN